MDISPLNHHTRQAWSKHKSSSHNNRSWHWCLEEDLYLLTGSLNNLQIWRKGTEDMIVSFVKDTIPLCGRMISQKTGNIACSASSPYLISSADCRLPADILSGCPREHGNCLTAFKHAASWRMCLWPCWRSGLEAGWPNSSTAVVYICTHYGCTWFCRLGDAAFSHRILGGLTRIFATCRRKRNKIHIQWYQNTQRVPEKRK